MKQVTENEFYAYMRPLNYAVTGGENKRTTLYKKRHSDQVFGKMVDSKIPAERSAGTGHTFFINQQ